MFKSKLKLKLMPNKLKIPALPTAKLIKPFHRAYTQIAIIYLAENSLHFFALNQVANQWKVQNYTEVQRLADDPYFPDEAIALHLENLPPECGVYLTLSPHYYQEQNLPFPELNNREIQKALRWEIQQMPKENYYNYQIFPEDLGLSVTILGIQHSLLEKLIKIFQPLPQPLLAIIGIPSNYQVVEPPNLTIAQKLIPDMDIPLWLSILTATLEQQISLLPPSQQPAHYNWQKIFSSFTSLLLILTGLCLGYGYYQLQALEHQRTNALSQNNLLQKERTDLQSLITEQNSLKGREKLLQQLAQNSAPFYPLIQELAYINTPGIQLTKIQIQNKEFTIQGRAVNYTFLNEYKSILQNSPLLNKDTILAAQRSPKDNFLDFTIQGAIPHE